MMKKLMFVLWIAMLLITAPVMAQRGDSDTDGDGVADSVDQCPNEAGSARNNGCPINNDDTGGRGDSDDDSGGRGDTDDETDPSRSTLPDLSTVRICVVATSGTDAVNIRQAPALDAAITGQLNPTETYPAYAIFLDAENAPWYQVDAGWVNGGVIRMSAPCGGLPQQSADAPGRVETENLRLMVGGSIPAQEEVVRGIVSPLAMYGLFCDGSVQIFTGAQDITGCDGSVIPFDGTQNTINCDGSVHPLMDAEIPCAGEMGLTLLLVSEQVGLTGSDGGIYEFNPQPDPPQDFCDQFSDALSTGMEEVGFNPQPDPPVACGLLVSGLGAGEQQGVIMIAAFDHTEDEQGVVVIAGLGSEEGIIIINGLPAVGEMAILMPSSDLNLGWLRVGAMADGSVLVARTEDGLYVCPDTYSGPDSNEGYGGPDALVDLTGNLGEDFMPVGACIAVGV